MGGFTSYLNNRKMEEGRAVTGSTRSGFTDYLDQKYDVAREPLPRPEVPRYAGTYKPYLPAEPRPNVAPTYADTVGTYQNKTLQELAQEQASRQTKSLGDYARENSNPINAVKNFVDGFRTDRTQNAALGNALNVNRDAEAIANLNPEIATKETANAQNVAGLNKIASAMNFAMPLTVNPIGTALKTASGLTATGAELLQKLFTNQKENSGEYTADEAQAVRTLQRRENEAVQNQLSERTREYAQNNPLISSLQTIQAKPMGALQGLATVGINAISGDPTYDSNSAMLSNLNSDIRGTVSEGLKSPVWSFLYNTGMSMADSVVAMATMGKLGTVIMGSDAATNSARDLVARGASKEQVLAGSVASGVFEALFEYISLDNLLKPKSVSGIKDLLHELFKQGLVEGSEEMSTEIANMLFDAVNMGQNSETDQRLIGYLNAGYSEEQAVKQTILDNIGQVALAGAGGALSGVLMGGGKSALDYYANKQTTPQNLTQTSETKQDEEVTTEETKSILGQNTSLVPVANNEEVSAIQKTDDGDLQVQLSDGRIASFSEVQFENEETANLYRGASKEPSTEQAKAYIDNYVQGMPLSEYANAYYKMMNAPALEQTFEQAKETIGSATEWLPDSNLQAIYAIGENAANNLYQETVSDHQTRAAKALGSALGVEVEIVDNLNQDGVAANGMYKDGKIYISSKSNDYALSVMAHELTHRMKETNAEGYQAYSDLVTQYYQKYHAEEFTALVNHYQKVYSTENFNSIQEEILAKASERFLMDKGFVKEITKTNRTLAEKIVDFLKECIEKLTLAIKNKSLSASLLSEEKETYGRARDLWMEALKETDTQEGEAHYSMKEADLAWEQIFDEMTSEDLKTTASILEEGTESLKKVDVSHTEAAKVAQKLKDEYGSTYSVTELTDNIEKVFAYLKKEDKLSYEDLVRVMTEVTTPMVEASTQINPDEQAMYDELRNYLKETPIKFNEIQKKELANMYGTYSAFRSLAQGKMNISEKNGTFVDSIWSEIAEHTSGLLQTDVTDADEPFALMEVLEKLKPVPVNIYGMDIKDMAYDAAVRVYEHFLTGKTKTKLQTQMNQYRQRIKKQYNEKLQKVKAQNRTRTDERLQAQKEYYQGMVQNVRDQKNERIDIIEARFKESNTLRRAKQHNVAQNKKAFSVINTIAKDITAWVNKPSDKYHVPEALSAPLNDFLDEFDRFTMKTDLSVYASEKWVNKMETLRLRLSAMEKDTESDFLLDLDPDMLPLMDEFLLMSKETGYKRAILGDDIGTAQTMRLAQIMKMLRHAVKSMNKLHANRRYETIQALGSQTLGDFAEKANKKPRTKVGQTVENLLNIDLLTPEAYFSRLGDSAYSIYEEIREGLNRYTEDIEKASEYSKDMLKDITPEELRTWSGEHAKIIEWRGMKFTPAQLMSLYCLNQRQQAQKHILEGGIKFTDIREKGKLFKRTVSQAEAKHVSQSHLEELFDAELNDRQKEICRQIQHYMSSVSSEQGNRVSMAMYGYEKFKEADYFPIKSDSGVIPTNDQTENQGSLYAIRNQGMTKSTVNKANNAIIVSDIFDVFTDHVTNMANYDAYAIPLSDAMKWFNYKESLTDNVTRFKDAPSVKNAIARAYGKPMTSYFINFMKDLNGEVSSDTASGIGEKLIANYKRAAVGANLRVAIQQPTAFLRALSEIDAKYLAKAFVGKNGTKEALEKSAIAKWKSWGYYDTHTGRSLKNIILDTPTAMETVVEKSMSLAQLADNVTWGRLWNAVKAEQSDLHPELQGEEFDTAVTKRFDEVIDKTQVIDTVIHRSQFMRSDKGFAKLESAFMAEPTKTYNMLHTAIMDMVENPNPKTKKKVKRVFAAFGTTAILNSLAQSLVDAFRDDDDEKKWLEKFASVFGSNAIDNLNPLTSIPYVKDLISILDGWDIERMDVASVSAAASTIKDITKAISGESTKTPYAIIRSVSRALSQLSGIPVYSAQRGLESIYNAIAEDPILMTKTKYTDLYYGITRDKDITGEIKKLLESGTEKSTISAQITSHFKKDYLELKESDPDEARNLLDRIMEAYVALGYDRAEKLEDISKWK